jgi:hypothetical protein
MRQLLLAELSGTGDKTMKDNDILAEVKRYSIDWKDGTEFENPEGEYVHTKDVMAREAALQQRLEIAERHLDRMVEHSDGLQQRVDLLEGMLRDIYAFDLPLWMKQRMRKALKPEAWQGEMAMLLEHIAENKPQGDPIAALEKARDVLRAIIRDKAAGVHYASAQAACHQINHALEQPQVKPVATVSVWHVDRWYASDPSRAGRNVGVKFIGSTDGYKDGQPLYAEQPGPVAVVLPERREPTNDNPYLSDEDRV